MSTENDVEDSHSRDTCLTSNVMSELANIEALLQSPGDYKKAGDMLISVHRRAIEDGNEAAIRYAYSIAADILALKLSEEFFGQPIMKPYLRSQENSHRCGQDHISAEKEETKIEERENNDSCHNSFCNNNDPSFPSSTQMPFQGHWSSGSVWQPPLFCRALWKKSVRVVPPTSQHHLPRMQFQRNIPHYAIFPRPHMVGNVFVPYGFPHEYKDIHHSAENRSEVIELQGVVQALVHSINAVTTLQDCIFKGPPEGYLEEAKSSASNELHSIFLNVVQPALRFLFPNRPNNGISQGALPIIQPMCFLLVPLCQLSESFADRFNNHQRRDIIRILEKILSDKSVFTVLVQSLSSSLLHTLNKLLATEPRECTDSKIIQGNLHEFSEEGSAINIPAERNKAIKSCIDVPKSGNDESQTGYENSVRSPEMNTKDEETTYANQTNNKEISGRTISYQLEAGRKKTRRGCRAGRKHKKGCTSRRFD